VTGILVHDFAFPPSLARGSAERVAQAAGLPFNDRQLFVPPPSQITTHSASVDPARLHAVALTSCYAAPRCAISLFPHESGDRLAA